MILANNGLDSMTIGFLIGLGFIFLILVIWWFFRIFAVMQVFLKAAKEILGNNTVQKSRLLPIYTQEEVEGNYKGRQVVAGVIYSGFKGEFLPLPFIRMRLKEVIGYNLNRLPHYAGIEKNMLIFKPKISLSWGVFDKDYPQIFSKSYFVIALEKLVATAEDLERGRTYGEIFK